MKKHHKPTRATAPMLVVRALQNTTLENKERMAVTAFSRGFANTKHFDTLLEMMNMMLIAGQRDESRRYILDYAEKVISPALNNIKQRYMSTGKLGVNSQELVVLREMVDHSKNFWNTQTTGFYNECVDELNAFYAEVEDKREEAA